MTVFLILSVVSCGLSVVSVTLSCLSLSRSSDFSEEGLSFLSLLDMRDKVERFSRIEESVVRSVMEEGGTASTEAILRTAERLQRMGVLPDSALRAAKEIHGLGL